MEQDDVAVTHVGRGRLEHQVGATQGAAAEPLEQHEHVVAGQVLVEQRLAEVADDVGQVERERDVVGQAAALETLTSIRRAGADVILTYFAKEAAAWLR